MMDVSYFIVTVPFIIISVAQRFKMVIGKISREGRGVGISEKCIRIKLGSEMVSNNYVRWVRNSEFSLM